jgi:hypothetical protein
LLSSITIKNINRVKLKELCYKGFRSASNKVCLNSYPFTTAMKKFFLVASSAIILSGINACKEVGPSIDLTPVVVDTSFHERAFDTTYTEAVPAADPKKVLVEEYTGVQCTNCPDGAQILKTYEESHPGRIVIAGLHAGSLTDPVEGESKYDFRNSDVLNMINSYFGENPPKPAAAIDRVKQEGAYFITTRVAWASYIDQRAATTPPVNIDVTSRYDSAHNKVVIKVKVVYTASVSIKQHLSVWVLEDNLVDVQLYPDHHDPNYVHNHVFRDFITPTIGASILDTLDTKSPGRVYERTFIYTPKSSEWNLDNCRIVAFVHNSESADKAVAQVAEVKVKE